MNPPRNLSSFASLRTLREPIFTPRCLWRACFYRSAAGAKIDLVLELPGHQRPWAVEIKRGRAPRLERGFHHATEDVKPERCLVVCGTDESFPMNHGVEAVSLATLLETLTAIQASVNRVSEKSA